MRSAALTAATYSRVLGANDRVRVALIGAGGQGSSDFKAMIANPDAVGVAVADVYQPNLDKGVALAGSGADGYKDFRRILDRKDVDAVIVGTPDHWHAIPTIQACQAGKDVYCEKPLSLFVTEGRAMLEAARKHNRIVQTGSQQRSSTHYNEAVEIVRSGKLGKVCHISGCMIRNAMPGWGKFPDSDPPAGLDWDMWLGPAPKRPYNQLRCQYHFRWFWDYSGGQMTNFGAHDLDVMRWAMGFKAPIAVAGFGGRYGLEDGGETPDTQEVVYQFPDCLVTWSVKETNAAPRPQLEFHGTKATLALTRGGYKLTGEKWGPRGKEVKQAEDAAAAGDREMHARHVRNFLDCVKSRKRPNADVEDGHLSATLCHLGNIASRMGRTLKWDAAKEQIVGDSEANKWLSRPYRAPWKLG